MLESLTHRHPWNVTPAQAREIQARMCGEVIPEDRLGQVRFVAGVDAGLDEDRAMTRAAVAVLGFPALELHEFAVARVPTPFPYVPGLLSFREIPPVLEALERLRQLPDLLLCDGHGLAHPRRFGIACHLGVLTGLPAVGVAKSPLIGDHACLRDEKGSWVPLVDNKEVVGAVIRTRTGIKPVYVSIGHKVSLDTATRYVNQCVTRYRLPETTRWAHRLASMPSAA